MDANLGRTGVRSGILQPDIILPSQYVGPRRLTPEHGLMIAVLRDAIDCVAENRHAEDYPGRRLFDEATQWLLAEKADWPDSFECICGVLDLDANAVRRALRLPERQAASCRARSRTPGMLRLEGAVDVGRLLGAGRPARRRTDWTEWSAIA